MYNGIGLNSVRGAGTSGHVRRNAAAVRRPRPSGPPPRGAGNVAHARLLALGGSKIRAHELARHIEVQVAAYEDELVALGMPRAEAVKKAARRREKLSGDEGNKGEGEESLSRGTDPDFEGGGKRVGAYTASGGKKVDTAGRMREALGIAADYEEGAAFRQMKRQIEAQVPGGSDTKDANAVGASATGGVDGGDGGATKSALVGYGAASSSSSSSLSSSSSSSLSPSSRSRSPQPVHSPSVRRPARPSFRSRSRSRSRSPVARSTSRSLSRSLSPRRPSAVDVTDPPYWEGRRDGEWGELLRDQGQARKQSVSLSPRSVSRSVSPVRRGPYSPDVRSAATPPRRGHSLDRPLSGRSPSRSPPPRSEARDWERRRVSSPFGRESLRRPRVRRQSPSPSSDVRYGSRRSGSPLGREFSHRNFVERLPPPPPPPRRSGHERPERHFRSPYHSPARLRSRSRSPLRSRSLSPPRGSHRPDPSNNSPRRQGSERWGRSRSRSRSPSRSRPFVTPSQHPSTVRGRYRNDDMDRSPRYQRVNRFRRSPRDSPGHHDQRHFRVRDNLARDYGPEYVGEDRQRGSLSPYPRRRYRSRSPAVASRSVSRSMSPTARSRPRSRSLSPHGYRHVGPSSYYARPQAALPISPPQTGREARLAVLREEALRRQARARPPQRRRQLSVSPGRRGENRLAQLRQAAASSVRQREIVGRDSQARSPLTSRYDFESRGRSPTYANLRSVSSGGKNSRGRMDDDRLTQLRQAAEHSKGLRSQRRDGLEACGSIQRLGLDKHANISPDTGRALPRGEGQHESRLSALKKVALMSKSFKKSEQGADARLDSGVGLGAREVTVSDAKQQADLLVMEGSPDRNRSTHTSPAGNDVLEPVEPKMKPRHDPQIRASDSYASTPSRKVIRPAPATPLTSAPADIKHTRGDRVMSNESEVTEKRNINLTAVDSATFQTKEARALFKEMPAGKPHVPPVRKVKPHKSRFRSLSSTGKGAESIANEVDDKKSKSKKERGEAISPQKSPPQTSKPEQLETEAVEVACASSSLEPAHAERSLLDKERDVTITNDSKDTKEGGCGYDEMPKGRDVETCAAALGHNASPEGSKRKSSQENGLKDVWHEPAPELVPKIAIDRAGSGQFTKGPREKDTQEHDEEKAIGREATTKEDVTKARQNSGRRADRAAAEAIESCERATLDSQVDIANDPPGQCVEERSENVGNVDAATTTRVPDSGPIAGGVNHDGVADKTAAKEEPGSEGNIEACIGPKPDESEAKVEDGRVPGTAKKAAAISQKSAVISQKSASKKTEEVSSAQEIRVKRSRVKRKTAGTVADDTAGEVRISDMRVEASNDVFSKGEKDGANVEVAGTPVPAFSEKSRATGQKSGGKEIEEPASMPGTSVARSSVAREKKPLLSKKDGDVEATVTRDVLEAQTDASGVQEQKGSDEKAADSLLASEKRLSSERKFVSVKGKVSAKAGASVGRSPVKQGKKSCRADDDNEAEVDGPDSKKPRLSAGHLIEAKDDAIEDDDPRNEEKGQSLRTPRSSFATTKKAQASDRYSPAASGSSKAEEKKKCALVSEDSGDASPPEAAREPVPKRRRICPGE